MATNKDIQDLTKSIHSLIKAMESGGSTNKASSKTTSSRNNTGLSEKQILSGFGGLEAQEKLEAEINERKEKRNELLRKEAEYTKLLASNQKNYGTELFKSLEVSSDIEEITEMIYETSEKISNAKKKGNAEEVKKLTAELKSLKASRENFKVQKQQSAEQEKINKLADKQLEKYKKITAAIKDPIKALQGLGSGLEKSIGTKFNAALASPKKSIMDIAKSGIQLGLIAGFGIAINRAFHLNQELVDMQRNFGVSSHEAHEMHTSIQDAAVSSKILGATTHDYEDAFKSLQSTFGTNVAYNNKILDTQVLLTKQIGMSGEAAKDFQLMSAGTGKTSEENLEVIRDQVESYNKLTNDSVSVRDMQNEIAGASRAALASYRGSVPALARAAIQAKKMGMTLDDTANVSKSLLDIQSSIENEMVANALTGKHMNMNTARQLALQGKSSEAAAEALRQVGSLADFMDLNVIQREAVADAAGMTVDQIVKAGQLEAKNALVGIKNLKDLTAAEKEKLIVNKAYTKEQLDQAIKAEQAAAAQEKMNQLVDKLSTLFDRIATSSVVYIVEGLSSALEKVVELIAKGKEMMKAFGIDDEAGKIIKAAAGIGLGIIAVKSAVGKIKEFFGQSKEDKQIDLLTQIADNTAGGGAGGGGDAGDSVIDSLSGKGKKKGFGRIIKAFRKGGIKGGVKAITRMAKQSGGIKGIAKSAMSGGLNMAKSAIGLGGNTASTATKAGNTATKAGSSVAKAAGDGGLFSGLIDKVKNSKFVGKVGDFAKKLNPLSALKKIFTDKSFISKLLGKIPKIGALVAMASTLYSLKSAAGAGDNSFQDVGKQTVMTLGDLGGSVIGGLLGSLGGPAAIAGSILGGMAGSSLAGVIADNVDLSGLGKMVVDILGPSGQKEGASPVTVQDALIRPGQPPILFDKNDIILAGTNLTGENSSLTSTSNAGKSNVSGTAANGMGEVAKLLKELIAKVDQPVRININGRVMDEIEKQTTLRKTYSTKVDGGYGTFG
jgi:hypothetical protein